MNVRQTASVRIACVSAVALIGCLVVAAGARSTPPDPARSVLVDSPAAARAVQLLAPDAAAKGLTVAAPVAGAVDTYYPVTGPSIHATVDVHDGRVTMMVRGDLLPRGRQVVLSVQEAEAAATAWLATHAIPIDGLVPKTELVDHGDASAYKTEFLRQVNGVVVPDSRTVYIDAATGKVFMLVDQRHPFAAPPAPKVRQEEAEKAALLTAGWTGASVDTSQLGVTFGADGSQRLVWQVLIRAPISGSPAYDEMYQHMDVEVDAIDGTSTIVGQG